MRDASTSRKTYMSIRAIAVCMVEHRAGGRIRMSDLISRQAILKHIEKIRQGAQMMDDIRRASIIMNGMYLCEEAVRNQPSAQPEIT